MRNLLKVVTASFAIVPERAGRFFKLNVNTHLEYPLSEIMEQQHQKYLHKSQQSGALLVSLEMKPCQQSKTASYTYLFQSPNEIQPFQFIKKSPLRSYLKDYQIEQIEMEPRMRDKEIAPKHLRQ